MASPLTHALVGATLAAACHFPWKLWVVGVASALLPDLDAAGYWLGVPYGSFWVIEDSPTPSCLLSWRVVCSRVGLVAVLA